MTTATASATATDRLLDGVATGTRAVARAALRTWLDLDVSGTEHVPATGGVLLAATHTSHADSLAIGAAVRRRLSFLGAANLADVPVLGPLLPRLGLLAVERGSGDVDLLATLADHLRDGAALVVYPEGSRSRDGAVHRPRSGVARLAAATGVPVVPVGITGTPAAWPIDGRPVLLGRPTVRVALGAALDAPSDDPRSRRSWTEQLRTSLVELSGRPGSDALAPVGGAA